MSGMGTSSPQEQYGDEEGEALFDDAPPGDKAEEGDLTKTL